MLTSRNDRIELPSNSAQILVRQQLALVAAPRPVVAAVLRDEVKVLLGAFNTEIRRALFLGPCLHVCFQAPRWLSAV